MELKHNDSQIAEGAARREIVWQLRAEGRTFKRIAAAPGDAVTYDLRDNRVTIETDPASGYVVGAMCG